MESLERYLRDLEERIDPAAEERLEKNWLLFADGRWNMSFFRSNREQKIPSRMEWPDVHMNDALDDPDVMIYSELCRMNRQLAEGGPELLAFRSNYGSNILPELLGAQVARMPYAQNSLPGCRPMSNAEQAIRRHFVCGVNIDLKSGYSGQAFATTARFRTLMKGYPKLERFCHIYMADTEGPCGILEMLFGSDFYYLFSDDPGLVQTGLAVATDAFLTFCHAWHAEFPPFDETHRVDWGWLHRGHGLIREDTSTNISPALYEEFVFPEDARILEELGGGAIHFCGKGDHLMPIFDQLPDFYALNLSQPEMNDMETVYDLSIRKGRVIFGLANAEVRRCEDAGIDLMGRAQAGMGIPAWGGDTTSAPEPKPRAK